MHGLFIYSVVWFISSAFCSFSYIMFIAQHFILWGANISFNLKSNMIIANMYICVYMYMLHATYIKLVCIQQPSLDHILDWRQVLLFFFQYIDDHDTCEQSFIFPHLCFTFVCVCMHVHMCTHTHRLTLEGQKTVLGCQFVLSTILFLGIELSLSALVVSVSTSHRFLFYFLFVFLVVLTL